MSEEKAITKSYLEKAINARAEKRWDQDIKLVCHNLQNSPFRYSKIKTGPNMHSEINNFNLEYPENCETMLANLFEDYDEIREETIKDRGKVRKIEVNPDIQADWKNIPFIPFDDATFDLIVFECTPVRDHG